MCSIINACPQHVRGIAGNSNFAQSWTKAMVGRLFVKTQATLGRLLDEQQYQVIATTQDAAWKAKKDVTAFYICRCDVIEVLRPWVVSVRQLCVW